MYKDKCIPKPLIIIMKDGCMLTNNCRDYTQLYYNILLTLY